MAASCRHRGLFLSLDNWQKNWGQDARTKKAWRAVDALNKQQLECNPTNAPVVTPGVYEDAGGVIHANNIRLEPYSSAVLMLTH